ncbi:MAG: ethanolamine ammonia-lyase subunit EutB [Pirellula sp.]
MFRRRFLNLSATTAAMGSTSSTFLYAVESAPSILDGESLVDWIERTQGQWNDALFKKMLGAANEFKEGDEIVGVAAESESARQLARVLLANTTIREIDEHAPARDDLFHFISGAIEDDVLGRIATMTLGQLKQFLLERSESEIHSVRKGLSSDVIGCVVKLMTNQELVRIGSKVFNPLPGSKIGSKGYMGARVQPNSPTDNVDDIRWQVFNAFAFAVGDVLLGTNPVSSDPDSVVAIERALQDILVTFGIDDVLPHCVLAHIDVQAEAEQRSPGSTALWFQSIAGVDGANKTFDISVEKMVGHARSRKGKYGLYFETGQGADFTNGHGDGIDMVLLESRKYGFARALSQTVAKTNGRRDPNSQPWVHLNDVAGFIGPEVFRSRQQLVRCCLEDIVMGKLHGLMIGLDVCSTLHMDVSLDDLGWCIDQIMPANPGYLMALPTRLDPMLGYLTTGYHDHVHVRKKFGFKVDDRMWDFFKRIGVIDSQGNPTSHFGDPSWIYLQYRRKKKDLRQDAEILVEAAKMVSEIRSRGLFIAEGHGADESQLAPNLEAEIQRIYAESKKSIWAELNNDFVTSFPKGISVQSSSKDRNDYILHPASGERLSDASMNLIRGLRTTHHDRYDAQIVVSDGLNALALTTGDQLQRLLVGIEAELTKAGYRVAPERMLVRSGRVRAGYRIGELLYGGRSGNQFIVHIIGERPGSGHNTLSIYATKAEGRHWGIPDRVDHNVTKVVSGIAQTALLPEQAARDFAKLLSN